MKQNMKIGLIVLIFLIVGIGPASADILWEGNPFHKNADTSDMAVMNPHIAGVVKYGIVGNELWVKYSTEAQDVYDPYGAVSGDWVLVEMHLALSQYNPKAGFPLGPGQKEPVGNAWYNYGWMTKNGNPIPGQFPYAYDGPAVQKYIFKIPISELDFDPVEDVFYAGAHAIVRNTRTGQVETAWVNCQDFPGPKWAHFEIVDLLQNLPD